jgi:DHA3 family macrolide efflux protein-like MFS transporter
MEPNAARSGMRSFALIWVGQLVSVLGSGLTTFGLSVWVYQNTGSVTRLALTSFFFALPAILSSPFAGILVDRCNRRWLMIVSDFGAGLCALTIALLLITQQLEVWHIYVGVGIRSVLGVVRSTAYSAVTPMLVPKSQLGRANGMRQIEQSLARVVSPALAGLLVSMILTQGVILIDFATFLFSITTLLFIRLPKLPAGISESKSEGSLFGELIYGWKYIASRRGLQALMVLFAVSNFLVGMVTVLFMPLVLTSASPATLGMIVSISGVGMICGSLAMGIWGGPKRKINGVLGFMLLCGLSIVLAGVSPSPAVFATAGFLFFFGLPIVQGATLTIWQNKIAPNVQGRVFAIGGMIAGSSVPLAYLLAGPLADHVFRPLLVSDGPLAGSIGRILGTGPARGIGLLFIVVGLLTMAVTLAGYLYPRVRQIEDELPDVLTGAAGGVEDLPSFARRAEVASM